MPMYRILAGLLALALFAPALGAQDDKDKPKDPPATPAEQYRALLKEYQQDQQDFFKALQEAKTQEDRNKVVGKRPRLDRYAGRFLELARKNPKDPGALNALAWVVQFGNFQAPKEAGQAADILLRDHVKDPGIVVVCHSLTNLNSPAAEKLLQAVLDKNPDHDVQGVACYALAARLDRQALAAGFGNRTAEAKKQRDRAGQLFDRIAGEYSDVNPVRELILAENTPAPAGLIRAVLEKTTDHNVKGKGFYTLALRLRKDAEQAADHDKSVESDRLNREAEKLLEQVVKKYADVPSLNDNRKLGERAKDELFELRHLAVGKPAPEIDGEDLDGKKFRLSDYKGKVVLLDFWGNW